MPEQKKIPFLDLKIIHDELKDELNVVFREALETCAFIGGPMLEKFERAFAQYVGVGHAVGVSSGTDALRLALTAMGIGPGDRVITVPNTFIATTEAVTQAGAKIDFVDVDPDTCLMDPGRLEALLESGHGRAGKSEKFCAVVPVHLYGQCADMERILGAAAEYGLRVLEDAAQAHGAVYREKKAGGMGDAAAFSFYPGKNLGALGEAGAVTTRDSDIADRVRVLRDHGQRKKYYHEVEGWNSRLDAIQAGALEVKLRRLDGWNSLRAAAADFYNGQLSALEWVKPVRVAPGCVSCYHLYVVHVGKRDELREFLSERGIGTGLHYPVPLHLQDCYRSLGYREGSFPAAERNAREAISLPMFPGITHDQQERVVAAIKEFGRLHM